MSWLAISEIVRNFGLVIGGAIGGIIGLYLAWKRATASTRQADAALQQADLALQQAQLARRVHVAELFNRAVGQLTHEKLEVKLNDLYVTASRS